MNRIDVVLAIVLALFAIRGFWRGFSREFFGFIGLIGGIAVAAATYPAATEVLPVAIPVGFRPVVAFAAVFFAVDIAAHLVGALVHRLFGLLFLSPVNRLAGAVFGVAKGGMLALIGLLLVRAYPPVPGLAAEVEHSRIARPLLALADEADHRAGVPPRRHHDPTVPEDG